MLPDKPRYINVKGNLLDLSIPKVMGIINITPDSFYKGSRFINEKDIIETAIRMTEDGADILDIGGSSTRPGALEVPEEVEKSRVLNAIRSVCRELPDVIVSIDTFRASVALEAVNDCGACIINDITGGDGDKNMFSVVENLNVPYVIMHMQGKPFNMQANPVYDDVVADILRWFSVKIVKLKKAGVKDLIIDPGFGFGKNQGHNFELLRRLGDFSITGLPVLAGISRKSMIWKTLGIEAEEALNGTSVLNTVALLNGADILRVHDVKEAVQAVRLLEKLKK
jgi:dihydropteroate synthase